MARGGHRGYGEKIHRRGMCREAAGGLSVNVGAEQDKSPRGRRGQSCDASASLRAPATHLPLRLPSPRRLDSPTRLGPRPCAPRLCPASALVYARTSTGPHKRRTSFHSHISVVFQKLRKPEPPPLARPDHGRLRAALKATQDRRPCPLDSQLVLRKFPRASLRTPLTSALAPLPSPTVLW